MSDDTKDATGATKSDGAAPDKPATRRPRKKKTASKKAASKKAASKKATTKKTASKKTASKKTASRKTASKRAPRKDGEAGDEAPKRRRTRKTASKRTSKTTSRGGNVPPKRRSDTLQSVPPPPPAPASEPPSAPAVVAAPPRDRVAIVAGLRTPFCKANTSLASLRTVDLAVECVKELVARSELDPKEIGLCVYGQVVPTVDWLNIAREVVLGAGLPKSVEAYSVSRACATSIQAMTSAIEAIDGGVHDVAIAGGADSTTDVPLKVSPRLRDTLLKLQRAKTMGARLQALKGLSPRDLFPSPPGFSREPATGEQMGEAAEKMAKLNAIGRAEQDRIAFLSHARAAAAWKDGKFAEEVMTLLPPPYGDAVSRDNIVRDDSSEAALAKLRPVFDRRHGTITAGNASPLTDGASALLLMRESKAKALGYTPLGFVKSWAYAAVDPGWQLLMAPPFAAPLALERAGMSLGDMDLVDMHEAFAAQVACNLKAMASQAFADEHLGGQKALGEVDPEKLNVNGGSIALGHPFAATGGRMVLSTLKELGRRGGGHALLTLCAAGGLGAAVVLEAP